MNRNELMITSFDMLVESDSIVRGIDAFVDTLNLQDLGFTLTTSGSTGRPAYDPAVLLKLYIYGYKNAIRSSRKLQRECHIKLRITLAS